MIQRIAVTGPVGSGKTTLARRLSRRTGYPYTQMDDVVWVRAAGGDVRRDASAQQAIVNGIICREQWILEGVRRCAFPQIFPAAHCIVLLDMPLWLRTRRILSRWVKQRTAREACSYAPTFAILVQMLRWNWEYTRFGRRRVLEALRPYGSRVLILRGAREVQAFLASFPCAVDGDGDTALY